METQLGDRRHAPDLVQVGDLSYFIGGQVQNSQSGAPYRELSIRPQVLQAVVAEVELLELRVCLCVCLSFRWDEEKFYIAAGK